MGKMPMACGVGEARRAKTRLGSDPARQPGRKRSLDPKNLGVLASWRENWRGLSLISLLKSFSGRLSHRAAWSLSQRPSGSAMSRMALRLSSMNSSKGIPIRSHSRMISRFTLRANAVSFIRLRTDFVLTLASFLSG